MKKKFVLFTSLVTLLLLATTSVFAANPVPGVAVSNAVIQNLTDETAALVIQYYSPSGALQYTNTNVSIPGNSVREVKSSDEPLPAGFAGSAVVSADKEVAAIVSIRYTDVPADPDGKAQGAYNGFNAGSGTINFPSLWDFDGISSQFTVMNTEGSTASVDLTYYDRQGNQVGTTDTVSIPAFAGKTFDMANDSDTPANFGQMDQL